MDGRPRSPELPSETALEAPGDGVDDPRSARLGRERGANHQEHPAQRLDEAILGDAAVRGEED
eukprot:10603983-Alexandrium_andersonii.AAC.1